MVLSFLCSCGLWWEWAGVLELDITVGIHPDEFTFAQVEVEVVLCSCGLDVVEGSLNCV